MRVISQDGTLDLPYERIVFSLVNNVDGCSVMASSEAISIGAIVARYSTEENAKDAMSYLHAKYNDFIFDKYANYKIDAAFRFPADEEI